MDESQWKKPTSTLPNLPPTPQSGGFFAAFQSVICGCPYTTMYSDVRKNARGTNTRVKRSCKLIFCRTQPCCTLSFVFILQILMHSEQSSRPGSPTCRERRFNPHLATLPAPFALPILSLITHLALTNPPPGGAEAAGDGLGNDSGRGRQVRSQTARPCGHATAVRAQVDGRLPGSGRDAECMRIRSALASCAAIIEKKITRRRGVNP